ncbi:MAG: FMN-binding glutamate synthase family protein [Azoarcus sp.]|jgi:glutamate synthase domain-containing protein 2|nr:FMN-binding glutamate synthase family protein [Azoarcus sp.]
MNHEFGLRVEEGSVMGEFSVSKRSKVLRFSVWWLIMAYAVLFMINRIFSWEATDKIMGYVIVEDLQTGFFIWAIFLSLLGFYDVWQRKHSILRNYPVIGHFRYLIELVRPELRQYLLESDEESVPFSRAQRSLVYQRAKNLPSEQAFGSILDVYATGYEFLSHSLTPVSRSAPETFRIGIGNAQCAHPYSASIFNISAMSFGSLSANAIRALNAGARRGNFYHDTGEGCISPYHLEHEGDLVWELGSGYFGCRDEKGNFDPARFAEKAAMPGVKMIEIKLNQGAKPGHGGILPKEKITPMVSKVRGIPMGQDCVSPSAHSAFHTPLQLLEFVQKLRELSQGKPVGFKLCVGRPSEFMGIVKAMLQTGIYPDFIIVDGAEGGTGAAPVEFANHMGMPLREGLLLAHNTLVGTGLREHVRIGASGKIISAFDIARALALGADWANSARGFLFALGCVQSMSCQNNKCPTGVATQDEERQKALDVVNKTERVFRFHYNTLHSLSEMLAAAGFTHPADIRPEHLLVRVSEVEVQTYAQRYEYLLPGALLAGADVHPFYSEAWNRASAEAF